LNDIDQFFGALGARAALMIRIDDVHPNMILDDFSHQAVHRPARSDDEMEDGGASFFLLDRALERLDLTEDAAHPVEELGFFFDGVSHMTCLIPKGVCYYNKYQETTIVAGGQLPNSMTLYGV
jgi:hypothetical protein